MPLILKVFFVVVYLDCFFVIYMLVGYWVRQKRKSRLIDKELEDIYRNSRKDAE